MRSDLAYGFAGSMVLLLFSGSPAILASPQASINPIDQAQAQEQTKALIKSCFSEDLTHEEIKFRPAIPKAALARYDGVILFQFDSVEHPESYDSQQFPKDRHQKQWVQDILEQLKFEIHADLEVKAILERSIKTNPYGPSLLKPNGNQYQPTWGEAQLLKNFFEAFHKKVGWINCGVKGLTPVGGSCPGNGNHDKPFQVRGVYYHYSTSIGLEVSIQDSKMIPFPPDRDGRKELGTLISSVNLSLSDLLRDGKNVDEADYIPSEKAYQKYLEEFPQAKKEYVYESRTKKCIEVMNVLDVLKSEEGRVFLNSR